MVTQKKIAVNRLNALKARGTKTNAGKGHSSKNAFKHDPSRPLLHNSHLIEHTRVVAQDVVGVNASDDNCNSTGLAAEAYVEMENVI
jgi:hypothetical protein